MRNVMLVSTLADPFQKLWRGQQSLPKAFWLFFIIGDVIARITLAVLLIAFDLRQEALLLIVIATIIYPAFAAVGVWRSADVYLFKSPKVYALRAFYVFGAKFVVCAFVILAALQVAGIRILN